MVPGVVANGVSLDAGMETGTGTEKEYDYMVVTEARKRNSFRSSGGISMQWPPPSTPPHTPSPLSLGGLYPPQRSLLQDKLAGQATTVGTIDKNGKRMALRSLALPSALLQIYRGHGQWPRRGVSRVTMETKVALLYEECVAVGLEIENLQLVLKRLQNDHHDDAGQVETDNMAQCFSIYTDYITSVVSAIHDHAQGILKELETKVEPKPPSEIEEQQSIGYDNEAEVASLEEAGSNTFDQDQSGQAGTQEIASALQTKLIFHIDRLMKLGQTQLLRQNATLQRVKDSFGVLRSEEPNSTTNVPVAKEEKFWYSDLQVPEWEMGIEEERRFDTNELCHKLSLRAEQVTLRSLATYMRSHHLPST
ncbi:hypothetical protein TREMEDRAFT_63671 [Tremella mesenterica DSM 1558]|uniref:uncharacterized protein n=1 Tax=Tremella mesenterica (strain ATCC 24925 / CBS 8224 / DSM 1558 / NBRC 9311 / NRRL Y-6157 / RJB 2259-6 / UBC 559-6) TaxID=578456 RepID=UPI0003F493AC|nr:uncharacterized protein TREMEDRAFT_63671 [Tremella mesenterica DSM 1558]EIW68499.1 hypothetical protein TREMEDRAFT_63671 [Tremella mesenterica DSM 1558]